MKKVLIGLAVVAAWLLGVAIVAWRVQIPAKQALGRARRIAELGEAQKDLAGKQGPPLAEACRGKLTPQGTHALVGYTQEGPGSNDPEIYGVLVGASQREDKRVAFQLAKTFYDPSYGYLFKYCLSPFDWKHCFEYSTSELRFDETKYVAVSAVSDLVMASLAGPDKFDPGRARYYTRVLSFPDGQTLCEGSTTLRMKLSIQSSGRAKTQAEASAEAQASAERLIPFVWGRSVVATPLADLCDLAGGRQLCETMAEETSNIHSP